MQDIYVKMQENSQYLENIKFEQTEGYIPKVVINAEQLWKVTQFTTKCYIDENGGIQVPNSVPGGYSEQEENNTIAILKARLDNAEKDAQKKQLIIDGQGNLINFISKKVNDMGTDFNKITEEYNKQKQDDSNNQNKSESGGVK